jgi:hypothetical protein
MSQPSGKRSISAIVVGLLLLAGAFLPWRGATDVNVTIGLGPGCGLYDAKASELFAAMNLSLFAELTLLVLAAVGFIASGLLRNRKVSRLLAFSGVIGTVAAALLTKVHVASVVSGLSAESALPSWAQNWSGAGGFDALMSESRLGLGMFLTAVGTCFGLALAISLLGEAKEDDGTTWLTPLARRSWFFELIEDFWFFLVERKAWWMTPIVVVLMLLVLLIIVSEKAAVLPFIYTLF